MENRGKEGEGDDFGSDGEEVLVELDDNGYVVDGFFVISRVSEGFLVRG